jgi:hypothetical protein
MPYGREEEVQEITKPISAEIEKAGSAMTLLFFVVRPVGCNIKKVSSKGLTF